MSCLVQLHLEAFDRISSSSCVCVCATRQATQLRLVSYSFPWFSSTTCLVVLTGNNTPVESRWWWLHMQSPLESKFPLEWKEPHGKVIATCSFHSAILLLPVALQCSSNSRGVFIASNSTSALASAAFHGLSCFPPAPSPWEGNHGRAPQTCRACLTAQLHSLGCRPRST